MTTHGSQPSSHGQDARMAVAWQAMAKTKDNGPYVLLPSSTRCGNRTQASPTSCIHPPGGKHLFIWRRCSTQVLDTEVLVRPRSRLHIGKEFFFLKKKGPFGLLTHGKRTRIKDVTTPNPSIMSCDPARAYSFTKGMRASQLRASNNTTGSSLREPNTNSSSSFKNEFKPLHLAKHSPFLPTEHPSSQ